MAHIQLFISAVTSEFRSYRDSLRDDLTQPDVSVVVQEGFVPTGTTTLKKLDHHIKHCTAVIHLVGNATGASAGEPSLSDLKELYPDLAKRLPALKEVIETGTSRLSYTQWEAYLAIYLRKPLLIAVPEADEQRDQSTGVDQQAAQQAHLERLKALGHYAEIKFANADRLAIAVLKSPVLRQLVQAGQFPQLRAAVAGPLTEAGISHRPKPIVLPYPSIHTLLKGRDELMAALHQSLVRPAAGPHASVISNAIHGLGGIGKTRAAVEYAWHHREDYTAVLFVVANTPEDLRRNLAALVEPSVLDLPEQKVEDEEARATAVVRWLNQIPGWLLIIDNVDTEPAAEAVENLLAELEGGHVLITSRLARWSAAVERLDLGVLSDEAAVSFLLERTAKDRRKTADDEAQARIMARELGNLALALEQAGAYINRNRHSFATYLAEWHAKRAKVTAWFDERVMKYPNSVAVTWQTSFDQLGAPARALLQRLAWLGPEPIPESLLDVAVPDDSDADQRAALADLETYSLVTRASEAPTFTVHRLVQDVTRRSLDNVRSRQSLVSALRWIDAAFSGDPDDLRVRPTLDPLAPHVRAVTDHADAGGIPVPTAALLGQLADLLQSRVPLAEVEPLYRRALAIFDRLAKADPDNAGLQHYLLAYYSRIGDVLVAQGNLPEALKSFRDSLAIADRLAKADPDNAGWQRALAVSYGLVGGNLMMQGNLPEALKSLRGAVSMFERLATADQDNAGWQRDLSVTYIRIGDVLEAQGHLPEALKSFRDALSIRKRLAEVDPDNTGWQRDLSVSYNRVGDVLVAQGDLPDALKSFRDGLAIAERLAEVDPDNTDRQRNLSISYEKIGDLLAAQGKGPEALKSFHDTFVIRERLAKADPANVLWQTDLLASHWKLASQGDDSARRWPLIVETLRKLKADDKLTHEQATRWLPEAEKRLAELNEPNPTPRRRSRHRVRKRT
jgi:tetratricopeptide (TPR) repeat protein